MLVQGEDVTLTVELVNGDPQESHPIEDASAHPSGTAFVRANLTSTERNRIKDVIRASNLSCPEVSSFPLM